MPPKKLKVCDYRMMHYTGTATPSSSTPTPQGKQRANRSHTSTPTPKPSQGATHSQQVIGSDDQSNDDNNSDGEESLSDKADDLAHPTEHRNVMSKRRKHEE
ncbi:hypothetical protein FCIRC_927 [Fusarium circinatum]|uniref:Uncharacterized protein n=1 Tax=Fusarium circinatum TaxID=48490 RepID=A0A8H5X7I7_FUSCI|nr:hypothetical protein FCIRC_927 [Fusarium circinatum]